MSDAPERISLELRQGMADDFWSECRDPRYAKSEPVAYVRADRLEAQEALLREAMCGLSVLLHVYDGVPMNPIEAERRATDARAIFAKLRGHLEDKT